jgi:hypothetical protein
LPLAGVAFDGLIESEGVDVRHALLLLELAPLLLGPTQLLDGRCQVQEVNCHDRGARPEISVADKGVELSAGFDDAGMNEAKTVSLLGAVIVFFSVRVRQRGLLLS